MYEQIKKLYIQGLFQNSLLFIDCSDSDRSPLGCRLYPLLDAQQHLPIHHQTDRFHENAVDKRISQTRVVVVPRPADHPRSPVIKFVQKEHPAHVKVLFRHRVSEFECTPSLCVGPYVEDERPARLDGSDREGDFGMEPYAVPNLKVLKLRDDSIRVVDVTANQVLEPFVAVHPALALPHLHEPRPGLGGRSSNGDGMGVSTLRVWYQVITRQGPVNLGIGRSPLGVPEP